MKYFDKTEIRRLLEAARQESDRAHLFVLMSYLHALRPSETCAIRGKHLEDGALIFQHTKGSNKIEHPLQSSPDPLFDEVTLIAQLGTLAPEERLFSWNYFQWRRLFIQLCQAAEIPRYRRKCHSLRHSAAMHTLPLGLPTVQKLLGHKSIKSTGIYVEASQQQVGDALRALATGGVQ